MTAPGPSITATLDQSPATYIAGATMTLTVTIVNPNTIEDSLTVNLKSPAGVAQGSVAVPYTVLQHAIGLADGDAAHVWAAESSVGPVLTYSAIA